jgi:hypothetical protein
MAGRGEQLETITAIRLGGPGSSVLLPAPVQERVDSARCGNMEFC